MNETNPPAPEEADGTADVELLRAISRHPECAHVLAAIAAGGDPAVLIGTLLPSTENDGTEATPAAEPPMYCPPTEPPRPEGEERFFGGFLAQMPQDFWDDLR